jgi:hypothetical protein
MKFTSPKPFTPSSQSPFGTSPVDAEASMSPRVPTLFETPETSPSSSRLATPASENEDSGSSPKHCQAPFSDDEVAARTAGKRASSPKIILGQLSSLELLYASSAFEDSAGEALPAGQSIRFTPSDRQAAENRHYEPPRSSHLSAHHNGLRAQTEPHEAASAARTLVRRRRESLPPDAKAPRLYQNLPTQAADPQTESDTQDEGEALLDMLTSVATDHDEESSADRSVSPENSKAQALGHLLGHTGTSRIRTTASLLTIPSSPTTRDEWDTDTDDYALRPLRITENADDMAHLPVCADIHAHKLQGRNTTSDRAAVGESPRPSNLDINLNGWEDKQSVLDAIAK